jgi:ketosteroid isomerase-like protein
VTTLPDIIGRYYHASASGDLDVLLSCFSQDAHVHDEDRDYDGLDAIRGWRESVATRFAYTTQITGVDEVGDGTYVVHTHLEGDFPGGVVDLEQRFTLANGLITELVI